MTDEPSPQTAAKRIERLPNGEFFVIHPLDDSREEKNETKSLGYAPMAPMVKWSLVALRSYLTFVDGPAQVESRISSDSRFSGDLTLWDQHGSHVIRGNLILLPLSGNQLIAIELVYIEAEQTRIPTLARVVLGQLSPDDRKIEWAGTLMDAESLLVGTPAPSATTAGEFRFRRRGEYARSSPQSLSGNESAVRGGQLRTIR
jgi:hypothetical protein